MDQPTPSEDLCAESEHLRGLLRRAAHRLNEFTDQLITESRKRIPSAEEKKTVPRRP